MTDGNLPLDPRETAPSSGWSKPIPTNQGEVVLRNVGPNDWIMASEGEPVVTVPCKRRLGVRTMVIDFGPVQGRISAD
jgi:hypothetical protein